MTTSIRRLPLLALAALLAACTDGVDDPGSSPPPQTTTDQLTAFSDTVYPILRQYCADCHAGSGPGTPHIAHPDPSAAYGAVVDNQKVNLVAPEPVTNAEFTSMLARVLGRPAFFHAPAFMLRLVMGEMADSLLLSGARVLPQKLTGSGFEFRHASLESAFADMLKPQTS